MFGDHLNVLLYNAAVENATPNYIMGHGQNTAIQLYCIKLPSA